MIPAAPHFSRQDAMVCGFFRLWRGSIFSPERLPSPQKKNHKRHKGHNTANLSTGALSPPPEETTDDTDDAE